MRLTHKDITAFSSALLDINSHLEPATLPQKLIEVLSRLIPSEVAAWNEVDHKLNRINIQHNFEPKDLVEHLTPALLAHAHEHPVNNYQMQTGAREALKISDFLSQRQFERLGIYNEFYRPLGLKHQISLYLPGPPSLQLALTLQREGRDFSERDRILLNLLSPHIAAAYSVAKRFDSLSDNLHSLQKSITDSNMLFLNVSKSGDVLWSSSDPVPFFARAGMSGGKTSPLPVMITAFVATCIEPVAQSFHAPKGILRVAVQTIPPDHLRLSIKLQPHSPEPESLRSLGLSKREAEVLQFLTAGKTNPEIASILHISPRTVQKHIEHIFQKLGVENRLSATLRALDSLG